MPRRSPSTHAEGRAPTSAATCGTISVMATFDPIDERLRCWIASHRRVFALTGAGCSTASGIPDYRDDQGEWKRRPPVMIQAFRARGRCLPALLGACLHRLAALHGRRARYRASRLRGMGGRRHAAASRDSERGRPAPACRQPRGRRSPRSPRRRHLPRLRRAHVARDASGGDGGREPGVAGCRSGGAGRRRRHRPRRRRFVRGASLRTMPRPRSSRTSCSSVRTSPASATMTRARR